MKQLDDLPLLVLEIIVHFLDYSELVALMRTNTFFLGLIEDLVWEEAVLPANISEIPPGVLKKPVLRLSINLPFDADNVGKTNETLTEFASELKQFNISKTGELKVVLSSQNDVIWPDVTRIYYHFLLILILESKLKHNSIKRLEIQLDFLCDQCRSFLEKLPGLLIFNTLEKLRVNCINYNDTPTVGLYVHFLKMIFNFAPLKYFELTNIPLSIFEELKAWFLPGNMYFSQIRSFKFFTKPSIRNCLFFIFDGLLIENLY
eukprot:GFUD01039821.1.p1 GENE.GFUD01039821.1~~GFUD01039821.1.p1  ORF type:complete len:261 (-),score=38.94 GFUD01039821.1:46-828(-)